MCVQVASAKPADSHAARPRPTDSAAYAWGDTRGVRCAAALPLRSTEPDLGAELFGDGFFRIRRNASAAIAAVAALPPGAAYAVNYLNPLDEIAGANAWLMNFLNSTTPSSVAFYYDIVRVPDAVWRNGTANKIDLNSYLLDTLGYDCVLDRAVEASDQALYANFLHVSQSFSYVVVGLAPTFTQPSLVSQLFVWAVPFDVAVWAIIVTTFFLSSGLMTWFEDDSPHVLEMLQAMKLDKVKRKERYARLLIQGLYTSFSSFLTQNSDTFVAQSLPGRVYRTFWAFVILLTIFSYLANLSAFMSVLPKPSAVINSVADFTTKGRPACILDQPDDLKFMASNYPDVALIVIPGMHGVDLFRAITDPSIPCTAGVMPNVLASFLLGPEGDPSGQWCNLEIVGRGLSNGFYAIPFNTHFSLPLLASLSSLAATVVTDGTLDAVNTAANNFPSARPNCFAAIAARAQLAASQTVKSRSVKDFAGVWLVLAAGVTLATLLKLARQGVEQVHFNCHTRTLARRTRARLSGLEDGINSGEEDEGAVRPMTTEEAVKALSDLVRDYDTKFEAASAQHRAKLDRAHALILETMKYSGRSAPGGVHIQGHEGDAAAQAGDNEPAQTRAS
jgi:hypothetical protein